MIRRIACGTIALMLCLATTFAQAAPKGREGGKEAERKPERNEPAKGPANSPSREPRGNSAAGRGQAAPGGNWSERSHQGGMSANQQSGHVPAGAAAMNRNNPQASGAQGTAAGAAAANHKQPQASGEQGAAAGAAAANRNNPQASDAQGAAAGAAAANRRGPQNPGAEGAAVGAAAANRNNPQVSGAQGAAAGAAVSNRNNPQVSGAEGAAAGAAVANRNAPQFSGAAGVTAGSAYVRNSYNNPHLYDQQWYGANPGVWAPRGWGAGAAWAPTTWGAASSYIGANNTQIAYNYGTNLTYQDGNIMFDGQNMGTSSQFSRQAADLAQAGAAAEVANTDEWLALGVFAMVRNEQQHPQLILQLAINKQGILRGNYTDELTEHTQPIQGAVDPKTQRAAWTVGTNQTSVMEAGLSNLVQGEAPALIHKNGKTDHWLLVRLDQPTQGGNANADPAAQQ
jgi:hypothetical protein